MYWLRRIPAETRIVVLVVFLALFQAVLLSVFGLGAIRQERQDAAQRLQDQALDFLAVALTTLQAISERRVERLVNPDLSQGLPAFLTREPGLSSGYMMVQITAASLVAESRALAMPASIGSIPTDANQEDFVPMGMAAAFKASRIAANARQVLAAEFLCAAQGLEFLPRLLELRSPFSF